MGLLFAPVSVHRDDLPDGSAVRSNDEPPPEVITPAS
jgi:hypothetical protein